MGPGNKDNKDDKLSDYSYLSWDVANWIATRDGWTTQDTARETGVSESEAKEAMESAKEDGSN